MNGRRTFFWFDHSNEFLKSLPWVDWGGLFARESTYEVVNSLRCIHFWLINAIDEEFCRESRAFRPKDGGTTALSGPRIYVRSCAIVGPIDVILSNNFNIIKGIPFSWIHLGERLILPQTRIFGRTRLVFSRLRRGVPTHAVRRATPAVVLTANVGRFVATAPDSGPTFKNPIAWAPIKGGFSDKKYSR